MADSGNVLKEIYELFAGEKDPLRDGEEINRGAHLEPVVVEAYEAHQAKNKKVLEEDAPRESVDYKKMYEDAREKLAQQDAVLKEQRETIAKQHEVLVQAVRSTEMDAALIKELKYVMNEQMKAITQLRDRIRKTEGSHDDAEATLRDNFRYMQNAFFPG